MNTSVTEASYSLNFRKEEASILGEHLKHRHSVDIIGMKRIGISNFLRFFLYHKDIVPSYISKEEKHLFIPVDLHDLVEREIFPFWTLTLKRIVDKVESSDFPQKTKHVIENLFLRTIQSRDLFIANDSVRKALGLIIDEGYVPTIFFIRFDRIKDSLTPEFYSNIQGLKDATHNKLSYVFTSYRSLDQLAPNAFTKASLSLFCQNMFLKLATHDDMQVIFSTYNARYHLQLSETLQEHLLDLVNGYVQYLQLSLIIFNEQKDDLPRTQEELFVALIDDERIYLQSEELWESLTEEEQQIIIAVYKKEIISEEQKESGEYLWDAGFILEENGQQNLFSPLFAEYVRLLVEKEVPQNVSVHFSRKEHALFSLLEAHKNFICEREEIIEAVWPESKELGISDWAIDRLVARVRTKLRQQNSPYEIKTIRTRGYELVEKI